MGQFDREAATAADWWTRQLSCHKDEFTDDQIVLFRQKLTTLIEADLNGNRGRLVMYNDNMIEPRVLAAAEAAGIDVTKPGLLGSKSIVWIDPGSVASDEGPCGSPKELPLLDV